MPCSTRGLANSVPPTPRLTHQKPPVCPPTDKRPRACSQWQQQRQARCPSGRLSLARRLCAYSVHSTRRPKFKLRHYPFSQHCLKIDNERLTRLPVHGLSSPPAL